MSNQEFLSGKYDAAEAIPEGTVVYVDGSGDIALVDGPTDQAGTAAVRPLAVAQASLASGAEAHGLLRNGPGVGLVGTGGWTLGDYLVAEYDEGALIAYDANDYSDGDVVHIVGEALETASAGAFGQVDVRPFFLTASIPA